MNKICTTYQNKSRTNPQLFAMHALTTMTSYGRWYPPRTWGAPGMLVPFLVFYSQELVFYSQELVFYSQG